MKIIISKSVEKFLKTLNSNAKKHVVELIERLRNGIILGMPISKNLHDIHKKLAELRFKDRHGNYRIFYLLDLGNAIYLIHAIKKKTRKISKKDLAIIKQKIKELNL